MNRYQYILIILLIFISSCGNYKRFTYLQTSQPEKPDSLYLANITSYKLQAADILHVKISSLDENVTKMFNQDAILASSSVVGNTGGGLYLMGYSIDKEGFITLPVLGKLQVAGLTLEEAKQKVQKLAESYITDARAEVRLISFKISLIGEFNRPGQYNIFNDKATIFEAISLGGDISYNGNRRRVIIVRNYSNGTKTIKVNLTQRDILTSPQYFLQPNDIVYVEPLKSTAFRLRVLDYSVFLTLITSTITAVLLISQKF
jgi:polysaccharide biosynthesis/export protein